MILAILDDLFFSTKITKSPDMGSFVTFATS
jgi:hypothetical protein